MSYHLFISLFVLVCLCGSINLPGQQPYTRSGKDHALFFAANDYKEWVDLENPISDAFKLAQVLINNYGFNCQIFPNPSQEDIRLKIREYWEKDFAPDEQLLIYLSGHGYFETSPKNTRQEKGKGYFIPSDGKSKSADPTGNSYLFCKELLEDIDAIPCKHILVILDACRCSKNIYKSDNRPGELSEAEQLFRDVMPYRTRRIITSGGKERTSNGKYHSPLTEGLLEGFASNGGDKGVLSFYNLKSDIREQNISPNPHATPFGGDNPNSDFLFLYKPSKEREMITDADGNEYPVFYLAGKQWLGMNLNLEVPDSYCYADDPTNCREYGRLYTWAAAKEACSRLGPGWRLPSDKEWKNLLISLGGYFDSERQEKIGNPEKSYSTLIKGGASGFEAPFGGLRITSDNGYAEINNLNAYLSSTQIPLEGSTVYWGYILSKWDLKTSILDFGCGQMACRIPLYVQTETLFSCRCVKD